MKGMKCPHCGEMIGSMDKSKNEDIMSYGDMVKKNLGENTEENDNYDTPGVQKKERPMRDLMSPKWQKK